MLIKDGVNDPKCLMARGLERAVMSKMMELVYNDRFSAGSDGDVVHELERPIQFAFLPAEELEDHGLVLLSVALDLSRESVPPHHR